MTESKGMMVYVLKDASGIDCTNNGITSNAHRVLLVGDGVPEIFEANDLPILKLVKRNISGRLYMHAEPIDTEGKWHMFGGNFIYTSDSRFPNDYPIPVHDRVE